jgi:oligopeptide transport system permease protein
MKLILTRVLTLWVIVSLTFLLMQILPGDPFQAEQALPKEIHEALRKHYGLEDPLIQQYWRYVKALLKWDLGPSLIYKERTVNDIINEGFPVSAKLGLEALFLAIAAGILIGAVGAIYKGKWQDGCVLLIGALGISMPSFILASFLQYGLGFKLTLFPIARWGTFMHTVLPAISVAALPAAFIARMTRSNLTEVLEQDYIKTARSKGISEGRILWVHAMRNALLPVITYLGPLTANILVGSFVVEKIFAIPGLGQWFVNSVSNRDYTVIMGLTVFYSLILLGMVLLVDIAYRYLDPRVKIG